MITVNGRTVEVVNSLCYLGAIVTRNGDSNQEVCARTMKAKGAMIRLTRLWKSNLIGRQTKVRLVKALIHPIFTYAAESWPISKKIAKKIDALEMWTWRRLLRVSWIERRTNKSIREELNIKRTLNETVHHAQLKYFGHIVRKPGHDLGKMVMFGQIGAGRRRGRPRCELLPTLAKRSGATVEEMRRWALDRSYWRQFCWSSKPQDEA